MRINWVTLSRYGGRDGFRVEGWFSGDFGVALCLCIRSTNDEVTAYCFKKAWGGGRGIEGVEDIGRGVVEERGRRRKNTVFHLVSNNRQFIVDGCCLSYSTPLFTGVLATGRSCPFLGGSPVGLKPHSTVTSPPPPPSQFQCLTCG